LRTCKALVRFKISLSNRATSGTDVRKILSTDLKVASLAAVGVFKRSLWLIMGDLLYSLGSL
jgi:hypothetical protein